MDNKQIARFKNINTTLLPPSSKDKSKEGFDRATSGTKAEGVSEW